MLFSKEANGSSALGLLVCTGGRWSHCSDQVFPQVAPVNTFVPSSSSSGQVLFSLEWCLYFLPLHSRISLWWQKLVFNNYASNFSKCFLLFKIHNKKPKDRFSGLLLIQLYFPERNTVSHLCLSFQIFIYICIYENLNHFKLNLYILLIKNHTMYIDLQNFLFNTVSRLSFQLVHIDLTHSF